MHSLSMEHAASGAASPPPSSLLQPTATMVLSTTTASRRPARRVRTAHCAVRSAQAVTPCILQAVSRLQPCVQALETIVCVCTQAVTTSIKGCNPGIQTATICIQDGGVGAFYGGGCLIGVTMVTLLAEIAWVGGRAGSKGPRSQ